MKLAILGAGCSGSSLAYLLVRGGFEGEIHLFDRRTDFSREQRWCSWGPVPEVFSELVDFRWPQWKVVSGEREALCRLPERPYLHVHAPAFYQRVHAELARRSSVHLHFGGDIHSVEEGEKGVDVSTSDGTLTVDLTFDSRPPRSRPTSRHIELRQSFSGWVVKSDGADFDSETVTLMDFGAGRGPGVSFVYVLPFGPNRALVESTTFSKESVSKTEHRARVKEYLDALRVSGHAVEAEEIGDLPMSTRNLPSKTSERRFMIGAAGGAMRPSSGYAFVPLMRQSVEISRAVIQGQNPMARPIPRKYRLFDEIFLDILDNSPELARESFLRMFERVPPNSLVRFLSSESDLRDEARLISALPKTPFVRAAIRRAAASLPGSGGG